MRCRGVCGCNALTSRHKTKHTAHGTVSIVFHVHGTPSTLSSRPCRGSELLLRLITSSPGLLRTHFMPWTAAPWRRAHFSLSRAPHPSQGAPPVLQLLPVTFSGLRHCSRVLGGGLNFAARGHAFTCGPVAGACWQVSAWAPCPVVPGIHVHLYTGYLRCTSSAALVVCDGVRFSPAKCSVGAKHGHPHPHTEHFRVWSPCPRTHCMRGQYRPPLPGLTLQVLAMQGSWSVACGEETAAQPALGPVSTRGLEG